MTQTIFRTKDYKTFSTEDGSWEGTNGHHLFNGDIVSVENDIPKLVRRTANIKYMVGVLNTSSKMRFGINKRGHQIYTFRPIDPSLPEFLVASKLVKQIRNWWVSVEYIDWSKDSQRPRGGLLDLFGEVGVFDTELRALYNHYRRFSWKKVATEIGPELDKITTIYNSEEWKERRDIWNETVVSIDPDGCRDIDDALSWDGEQLAIHITDVRPFIKPGSVIDSYASNLGQTLYGFSYNMPMLPPELSEELLSLQPGKERASITMVIGSDGSYQFRDTVIKNSAALTYENYRNYNKINWDSLYNRVSLIATEMGMESPLDSHQLVEVLMIYYNWKFSKGGPGIYRVQKESVNSSGLPQEIAHFALESANYSPLPDAHFCLGLDSYCHATSPIRRYADILAQRSNSSGDINQINKLAKTAKKFHRDYNYLYQIYCGTKTQLEAIVLDSERIYIVNWKQSIRCKNSMDIYSRIKVSYYVDPNPTRWKKRIVWEIV